MARGSKGKPDMQLAVGSSFENRVLYLNSRGIWYVKKGITISNALGRGMDTASRWQCPGWIDNRTLHELRSFSMPIRDMVVAASYCLCLEEKKIGNMTMPVRRQVRCLVGCLVD